MYTLPEAITHKVTELFNAIKHAQDDLQIECAEASLNADFSQLTMLSTRHSNLRELEADIATALNHFETKQKPQSTVRTRQPRQAAVGTRTSGGHLRVSLAGKMIEENTIANTFVETLKVFGFDRAARLNKTVCNIALFSKTPTSSYQTQQHIGGWYITTHVNRETAKSVLESVAKELNMPIRVEIVGC
jgi:hypothetical protein